MELEGVYKKISQTPPWQRTYYETRSAELLYQVYFGVGVTRKALEDYAREKGLISESAPFTVFDAHTVAHQLSHICDETLQLHPVDSPEHQYVLALYSNYGMWECELQDEDEKEVLAILNEELSCQEQLMWFHPR
jgi:hypothetical protein